MLSISFRREFPRNRFRKGDHRATSCRHLDQSMCGGALIEPGSGDMRRKFAHPRNHPGALRYRNCTACVEDVKEVRTLQAKVVGLEHREADLCRTLEGIVFREEARSLGLGQIKLLPRRNCIC